MNNIDLSECLINKILHPTILVNILEKLDIWDIESAYNVSVVWREVINQYKLW